MRETNLRKFVSLALAVLLLLGAVPGFALASISPDSEASVTETAAEPSEETRKDCILCSDYGAK